MQDNCKPRLVGTGLNKQYLLVSSGDENHCIYPYMNVHCTYRTCSKVNARMASMWFTKCYNMLVLISFMLFSCTTAVPITKRYDSIKEVNRKGPYIGLITVFPPEETAFFATGAFKTHPKHPILDLSGNYCL